MKTYFVYIVASKSLTLHVDVTSNLERRVLQHRDKRFEGFTARYNINRLAYFEKFGDVRAAIAREQQIKAWGPMRKVILIEFANRDWRDLTDGWYGKRG